MTPIRFPQSFRTLKMPEGEPGGDLPTWTDGREVISCWRAGWRERLAFLFTGRIWLRVLSGHTQPPVCVAVEEPGWGTPLSGPNGVANEDDVRAMVRAVIKRARKA